MNANGNKILISNGRIIDPGKGVDRVGDMLIADGKVVQLGGTIAVECEQRSTRRASWSRRD